MPLGRRPSVSGVPRVNLTRQPGSGRSGSWIRTPVRWECIASGGEGYASRERVKSGGSITIGRPARLERKVKNILPMGANR